jgi:lysyl-tRNA synthetase, class I
VARYAARESLSLFMYTSRARPSGSISTSSRAPSTNPPEPERIGGGATETERAALQDLHDALGEKLGSTDAEDLQAIVYEIGRTHFPDMSGKSKSPDGRPGVSKIWFETIYQILLGEERGPRFGSFIALYGVEETRELIAKALAGDLIAEHKAFLEGRS